MENAEIIIKNVMPLQMEELLKAFVTFERKDIISSHFFDQLTQSDLEYREINDLNQYCATQGSATISLKKVNIGAILNDVVILLCCDGDSCDVIINFSEKQFFDMTFEKMFQICLSIIQQLVAICRCGYGNGVVIGYEPANDDEMKIIEISKIQVKQYNNPQWETTFAMALLASIESFQI